VAQDVRIWALHADATLSSGQNVSLTLEVEGPTKQDAKGLFEWWMKANFKPDTLAIGEIVLPDKWGPRGRLLYDDPLYDVD
jgi:hypothetical protein